MPKMKTHRGSAKRFKKPASGKLKRGHAYTSHLFANKTKNKSVISAKRRLSRLAISNASAKCLTT